MIQRINPLANASLTDVYFLTAANKTNDNSPIRMSIDAGDQKLGFRLFEVGCALFAQHETRSLLQVPCSLGFVKQRHMFHRWTFINYAVVTKVVNVLNERFDFAHRLPFSRPLSSLSIAAHTVAREGLTQNIDKRLVA